MVGLSKLDSLFPLVIRRSSFSASPWRIAVISLGDLQDFSFSPNGCFRMSFLVFSSYAFTALSKMGWNLEGVTLGGDLEGVVLEGVLDMETTNPSSVQRWKSEIGPRSSCSVISGRLSSSMVRSSVNICARPGNGPDSTPLYPLHPMLWPGTPGPVLPHRRHATITRVVHVTQRLPDLQYSASAPKS
jgi:hypothetical protein